LKTFSDIAVRRFKEEDVYNLDSREDLLNPAGEWMILASTGYTFTLLHDNKPLALIGAIIGWPGAATAWGAISDNIRGRGLILTQIAKELLRQGAIRYTIRRYGCMIPANLGENIRWVRALGFIYEYTMYNATIDRHNVYGYVRWEKHHVKSKCTCSGLQSYVGELFGLDERS
jgi:hypothetical protein